MKNSILFMLLMLFLGANAQQDFNQQIQNFFNENRTVYQLTAQDISELHLASQGFSKSMNVHTLYVQQRYQSIEVFNALNVLAIDTQNKVKNARVGFVNQL